MSPAKQIKFTENEMEILAEIHHLGIATVSDIIFATCDFTEEVFVCLGRLLKLKAITIVPTMKVVNYSITGCGLETLYWEQAFRNACGSIPQHRHVRNLKLFRLRQKCSAKEPEGYCVDA